MKIGNGNSGGKNGIVRVLCGKVCGSFGSKILKREVIMEGEGEI